jgi:hypothetical protein
MAFGLKASDFDATWVVVSVLMVLAIGAMIWALYE